nr:hypothetical protein Hi04_10k_c3780_00023 [uncultured bacterium]
MRLQSESILVLATHCGFAGEQFGGFAHIHSANRIAEPQQQSDPRREIRRPETQHRFNALAHRFCAAQPAEFFRGGFFEKQRDVRHALGPAHDKNGAAASKHLLVCERDRLATRRAVALNGYRRHRFRNSGAQSDHSRKICGVRRLSDTAENDFVHQSGIEPGPREQRVDGNASQFVRSQPGEVRASFGERRPEPVNNYQSVVLHEDLSFMRIFPPSHVRSSLRSIRPGTPLFSASPDDGPQVSAL